MCFTLTMCCLAIFSFLVYFVSYGATEENVVSYAGAQVWRTNLRSPQDAAAIEGLSDNLAISVWYMNNTFVDYLIHASDQKKVIRQLQARGLETSTIIEDVQRTIDRLRPAPSVWDENALRNGHRLTWDNFPSLAVIYEYLTHLERSFPSLCNLTTIGYSVEKRPIKMLRISNGGSQNKAILMTGGVHAREWIAITSVLYLVNTLVTNFDRLPNHMRHVDWIIIPMLNPDGYEFSFTTDRLWRKNRQKIDSNCVGVDLNRNYDFFWRMEERETYSRSNCSDVYSGHFAFSEPETMAIRDLLRALKKLPDAFVDVHTYSQLILFPWGALPDPPRNHHLRETAMMMMQEIYMDTKQIYFFGNVYNTLYKSLGTAADWMYSIDIKHSYVFEMGPNHFHEGTKIGFLLEPEHIETNGRVLVAGMRLLAQQLVTTKNKKTDNKQLVNSFLNYTIGKISKLMGK